MENGILMAILLDIKKEYKKGFEEENVYDAIEKIDQAIECIDFLIERWHRNDLKNDQKILYKVKEAAEKKVDPEKFNKFITEVIFM